MLRQIKLFHITCRFVHISILNFKSINNETCLAGQDTSTSVEIECYGDGNLELAYDDDITSIDPPFTEPRSDISPRAPKYRKEESSHRSNTKSAPDVSTRTKQGGRPGTMMEDLLMEAIFGEKSLKTDNLLVLSTEATTNDKPTTPKPVARTYRPRRRNTKSTTTSAPKIPKLSAAQTTNLKLQQSNIEKKISMIEVKQLEQTKVPVTKKDATFVSAELPTEIDDWLKALEDEIAESISESHENNNPQNEVFHESGTMTEPFISRTKEMASNKPKQSVSIPQKSPWQRDKMGKDTVSPTEPLDLENMDARYPSVPKFESSEPSMPEQYNNQPSYNIGQLSMIEVVEDGNDDEGQPRVIISNSKEASTLYEDPHFTLKPDTKETLVESAVNNENVNPVPYFADTRHEEPSHVTPTVMQMAPKPISYTESYTISPSPVTGGEESLTQNIDIKIPIIREEQYTLAPTVSNEKEILDEPKSPLHFDNDFIYEMPVEKKIVPKPVEEDSVFDEYESVNFPLHSVASSQSDDFYISSNNFNQDQFKTTESTELQGNMGNWNQEKSGQEEYEYGPINSIRELSKSSGNTIIGEQNLKIGTLIEAPVGFSHSEPRSEMGQHNANDQNIDSLFSSYSGFDNYDFENGGYGDFDSPTSTPEDTMIDDAVEFLYPSYLGEEEMDAGEEYTDRSTKGEATEKTPILKSKLDRSLISILYSGSKKQTHYFPFCRLPDDLPLTNPSNCDLDYLNLICKDSV